MRTVVLFMWLFLVIGCTPNPVEDKRNEDGGDTGSESDLDGDADGYGDADGDGDSDGDGTPCESLAADACLDRPD